MIPACLESLHPQDAAEVLVDFSRALALSASRKEFSNLRPLITSQYQLIRSAAAAGAGFAAYISANGPDSAFLFLHADISSGESDHRSRPEVHLVGYRRGLKYRRGRWNLTKRGMLKGQKLPFYDR